MQATTIIFAFLSKSQSVILLEYFFRNKGVVKSRSQIGESVWEETYGYNSNVVDVYVNYLRNKIDKDFSPKLIHTVAGMGYIFKEGEE